MKSMRRLLALPMIALMLNTMAWSVSAASLLDWIETEQAVTVAAADNDSNGAMDSHESDGAGSHCNEGCHAVNHLQGIAYSPVFIHPLPQSFDVPAAAYPIADATLDGLFRPPRSSVPA